MKRIKVITKEETNAIREMYATGVPSQNALLCSFDYFIDGK